jgi:hypothetical protein
MDEVWRVIRDARNYEVSDLGRVRNRKTGRILKAGKNTAGQDQVVLMDGGFRLGRGVRSLVKKEFGFCHF